MDWVDDALKHIEGAEELRDVAERFLRSDAQTQEAALEKLRSFIATLEGEEKTKFTVMAVILETASRVMRERLDD